MEDPKNKVSLLEKENDLIQNRVTKLEYLFDRFSLLIDDKYIKEITTIQRYFRAYSYNKKHRQNNLKLLIFKLFVYNVLYKKSNIQTIKDIDINKIWYLNGNLEDIDKWDIFTKNNCVLTWNHEGKNENIKTKIKPGDIIAWYIVGQGFNSILKVLESPQVITSKDLIKFYPDWKKRFSTEEWNNHSIEHNYERIQIKVEFLATSNNIFLNQKDIIGWDNDWTYSLRGHIVFCLKIHFEKSSYRNL